MATYEGTEAMRMAFPQPSDILDMQSVREEWDRPTIAQEILASSEEQPMITLVLTTFCRGAASREPAMQPMKLILAIQEIVLWSSHPREDHGWDSWGRTSAGQDSIAP